MAQTVDLIAEKRTDTGKGASRRLRRAGKVPAIVYGAGREPRAVLFDRDPLMHKMENESFFSSVLNVKIGKNNRQCVIKDIQMHPAKRLVMHLDLQRIVEDELIRMEVPIHFLNEDSAIGVKLSGGSLQRTITEIEVLCLPRDLPEFLSFDVGEMQLGDSFMLSDLELPEGVEIPELTQGQDQTVVTIQLIKEVPIEDETEGEEGLEAADGDAPASDAEGSGDESKDD